MINLYTRLIIPRPCAPADTTNMPEPGDEERPLGIIPHQIRGQLAAYQNVLVHGPSYDRCTACSPKVMISS
jgi:ubiquitin-like modifier-activating enzyme ATG7